MGTQISNWTGSTNTYEMVKKQIVARWGAEEGQKYEPTTNCLTYKRWQTAGYQVKRGEKALSSIIVREERNKEGNVVRTRPIKIHLFYIKQVEKAE